MPRIGYERVAARVTRLEQSLAMRLNPRIEGTERQHLTAEDLSPDNLARKVATVAEAMMRRFAARMDADPTYLPPVPKIIRLADQAVHLHRLVFDEDKLRGQRDAQRAAQLNDAAARKVVLDWAQGMPPELRQRVVDAVATYWEPAKT